MSIEDTEMVWHKNTGVQPEETKGRDVFLKFRCGDMHAKFPHVADQVHWDVLGCFSDVVEWRLA